MDASTLRVRLREANTELSQLEERREALTSVVRGYEALLRLAATEEEPTEAESIPAMHLPTSGVAKGDISLRRAVVQVLREARGEPLHVKEIYHRARAMGARSDAKSTTRVTDLVVYNLITRTKTPIQKVGPSTYRWAGDDSDYSGYEPAADEGNGAGLFR